MSRSLCGDIDFFFVTWLRYLVTTTAAALLPSLLLLSLVSAAVSQQQREEKRSYTAAEQQRAESECRFFLSAAAEALVHGDLCRCFFWETFCRGAVQSPETSFSWSAAAAAALLDSKNSKKKLGERNTIEVPMNMCTDSSEVTQSQKSYCCCPTALFSAEMN